jgi:hypothetical protein
MGTKSGTVSIKIKRRNKMKQALVKVRLKYDFPDNMSLEKIIEEVENEIELPKEYDEDSFEWFGVQVDEDTLVPYWEFPLAEGK